MDLWGVSSMLFRHKKISPFECQPKWNWSQLIPFSLHNRRAELNFESFKNRLKLGRAVWPITQQISKHAGTHMHIQYNSILRRMEFWIPIKFDSGIFTKSIIHHLQFNFFFFSLYSGISYCRRKMCCEIASPCETSLENKISLSPTCQMPLRAL